MIIAEEKFKKDLSEYDFASGILDGKWGIYNDEAIKWPHIIIWIKASNCKEVRYYFKFDLSNYPADGPPACIWDVESNSPLTESQRPKATHDQLHTFKNNWQGGRALYIPCDRITISAKRDWRNTYPDKIWKSHHTITFYLNQVYNILNPLSYE